jgi:hypothetical protein
MSSHPPEPEKYSLDEMLDRLQQGKSEETSDDSGELVTRADGTQAIKIRKRKRRSTQPHKEAAQRNTRVRAVQISVVVILLVLSVLGVGSLLIYANSAPYRRSVVEKISAATGATTNLYQFRVNPTSSNIAAAGFEWPAGSLLKSATLTDIRTKTLLAGALSKTIGIDEVSVASAKFSVASPANGTGAVVPTTAPQAPSLISIERLGIAKTDITVGNPAQPALQILQAESSFYPKNINGRPTVRLFRGTVKAADWPLLRLDRGLIEAQGDEIEIVSLRLLHETDRLGNLTLSGHFKPHALDQPQTLAVKVESFNLSGIAGPSFTHILDTRIDSTEATGANQFTFIPSSGSTGKLSVAFVSSAGSTTRLGNFSFLSVLSQLLENRAMAEPIFDNGSTGVIQRENGVVRLTDLSLISKGQLTVTGDLTLLADDQLSGTLKVGIPEASVVSSPNPRLKKVFGDNQNGNVWVTLKISGTGTHPADNLTKLYEAGGPAVEPAGGTDLFEKLTAPK